MGKFYGDYGQIGKLFRQQTDGILKSSACTAQSLTKRAKFNILLVSLCVGNSYLLGLRVTLTPTILLGASCILLNSAAWKLG